jgi:hypothetical protein
MTYSIILAGLVVLGVYINRSTLRVLQAIDATKAQ